MKNKAGGFLADIFFPRRCPWCQSVLGFSARPCECEKDLAALWQGDKQLLLGLLSENTLRVWACYAYLPPASNAVWNLKSEGDASSVCAMGSAMARLYSEHGLAASFDAITPVPASAATRKQRGHNQAELLAKELANRTGLPVWPALRKQRDTLHQRGLSREQRLQNLKDAFVPALPPAEIQGKRILLVDDVVTTGSTLLECAHTLLRAGAAETGGLCFAATPAPETPAV